MQMLFHGYLIFHVSILKQSEHFHAVINRWRYSSSSGSVKYHVYFLKNDCTSKKFNKNSFKINSCRFLHLHWLWFICLDENSGVKIRGPESGEWSMHGMVLVASRYYLNALSVCIADKYGRVYRGIWCAVKRY